VHIAKYRSGRASGEGHRSDLVDAISLKGDRRLPPQLAYVRAPPKATEEATGSATMATQCRELLRNSATPRRLRLNPLAQTLLKRSSNDRQPRDVLESLIDGALRQLSTRERCIIQRCEIDCDSAEHIAGEMGISKRHLYRQRRRILGKLAVLLLNPPDKRAEIVLETIDSVDQLVKTSRVLEENGAYKVAAEVLERRAAEHLDPIERARLFLRLAELHARNASLARADESLEIALRHAASASRHELVFDAEIALTRALLVEESAKAEPLVAQLTEQSISLVRRANCAHYDPAAAAVLVKALSLRALAACFTGDLPRIGAAVAEIRETRQHVVDADAQCDALYAEHLASLFCENDLRAAVAAITQVMRVAQGAGLSISAIMAAVSLASIYRLWRDSAKAIAILSTRLDVTRALGNRKTLASLLIELAGAHVDLRDHDRARHLLDEASSLAAGNASLQASLLRTSATDHLAARRFGDALDESRSAAEVYSQLGKARLIGTSLRSQADALLAMGDRRGALTAIRSAIAVFSTGSHRPELARAYALLARISGNTRHLETAKKISGSTRSELRESAP
jgi:tetratricopeptide (TPR) repeat protein